MSASESEWDYPHSDSAGSENDEDSGEEEEEPVAAVVASGDVPDCCAHQCLHQRESAYRKLVATVQLMDKKERFTSLMTTISLAATFSADGDERFEDDDAERQRFTYYLPFVGRACKNSVQAAYDVNHRTLNLYRKRVHQG